MPALSTWLQLALLAAAGWLAFPVFRDLGDVTQFVLKVDRAQVLATFRARHGRAAAAAGLVVASVLGHLLFGWGHGALVLVGTLAVGGLLFQGYLFPALAMRAQQRTGRFCSIEEAARRVRPETSVIVVEAGGEARAHPDYEMWRPHVAGTAEGLGGEDVVLTYCALTNLGVAFKPEAEGRPLDLKVALQLENNLVLYDANSGEPIQQIWGRLGGSKEAGPALEPWPTFRMTFRAFAKAYPEGRVFLNVGPAFRENPIVHLWDRAIDVLFTVSITRQRREEEPVFPTIRHFDDRLPNKTEVWGLSVGDDRVAYTEDFVRGHSGVINARVGGRDVVVAWDPEYESLGAYFNDSGVPVRKVDFFGESDQGRLPRVPSLKPGAYWVVWANYFPDTDLNRVDGGD